MDLCSGQGAIDVYSGAMDDLLRLPSLQRKPLPDLAMLGVVPDPRRRGRGRGAVLRALCGGNMRNRLVGHGLTVDEYVEREAARLDARRGEHEQLRSIPVRADNKFDRVLFICPMIGSSRKADETHRTALAGVVPSGLKVAGGAVISAG